MGPRLLPLLLRLLFSGCATGFAWIVLMAVAIFAGLGPWLRDSGGWASGLALLLLFVLALVLTHERPKGRGRSIGRHTGRALRRLQDEDASSSAVNSRPRF